MNKAGGQAGKNICGAAAMLLAGLALGAAARLLDIYSQNLGNIFSQFAIWILLGVIIALYSRSARKAMLNILLFCVGMLAAYYAAAALTKSVYNVIYIVGWSAFGLLSPLFACLVRFARGSGFWPKCVAGLIILASFLSSIIFFDRLRIYDFIINAVTTYFLFTKRLPGKK